MDVGQGGGNGLFHGILHGGFRPRQLRLRHEQGGRIQMHPVKPGGIIKKGNPVATIDIPMASTGMPTLSKDITLSTGIYSIRCVSASKTTSTKGAVTICYADGIN